MTYDEMKQMLLGQQPDKFRIQEFEDGSFQVQRLNPLGTPTYNYFGSGERTRILAKWQDVGPRVGSLEAAENLIRGKKVVKVHDV